MRLVAALLLACACLPAAAAGSLSSAPLFAATLFDPQLIVLGPSAYVILDLFGVTGYKVFALAYPTVLGAAASTLGYQLFKRGDLP